MSLIMITEAMKLMEETDADFGMEEKEFIAQYAFRTGDTDLVKKLIEELQEKMQTGRRYRQSICSLQIISLNGQNRLRIL